MARKRRALVTVAGMGIVAVGLAAAWRTSDLGQAAGDLEHQRAAAKRAGVPTEWAELHRLTPGVDFDENAATLYTQVFAYLGGKEGIKGIPADKLLASIPAGTADAKDLDEARKALTASASLLEEAKMASRRKGFCFDRAWEKGADLLLPEYADAKNVARALILRAMLSNDPKAAADDVRAAARMRAQFGSEPILIASLVGNAIESDVHRGIRALAARGPAWRAAVIPALDDLGPIPALRRSLTSEAVMSLHFDEEFAKHGTNSFSGMSGEPIPFAMRLATVPAIRDASKARMFEYWSRVWTKLPDDPTDYLAAREALKAPSGDGPSYVILQVFLPVFDGFTEVNARSEADRRITRTALALWAGETPTIPKDPFSDAPLRLKREGSAWTLYSLGPDQVDDGGKPRGSNNGDRGYDLVVRSNPASTP